MQESEFDMRNIFSGIVALAIASPLFAEPVTVETYVRAETDTAIRKVVEQYGLGNLVHLREFVAMDEQTVIRQNRDTLYSGIILDLATPATVTFPEADGRYMSLLVVSQDHYMLSMTGPGTIELTEENVGSRFAYLAVRTFMNPDDPDDVAATHVAQDGITVTGGGSGPFEAPDWDQDQLDSARSALNQLSLLGFEIEYSYGTPETTRPIEHLVAAAAGWGGLPREDAIYQILSVADNDGGAHSLTVGDVPVDAFWSVTVYNADGFFDENPEGAYSFNGTTAEPNDDGSRTINFGDCDDGRVNCLPIADGWNYVVRLYQPRDEILNGDWAFPKPEATK